MGEALNLQVMESDRNRFYAMLQYCNTIAIPLFHTPVRRDVVVLRRLAATRTVR